MSELKKIYLCVPFDDKEYAKKNGCKWDVEIKRWYILHKEIPEELKKYTSKRLGIEDKEDIYTYKKNLPSFYEDKVNLNYYCSIDDYNKKIRTN